MRDDLPKRKHPRLDWYDYSSSGAYFVTICTYKRRCILSSITKQQCNNQLCTSNAEITLFPYGIIAAQQLLALEKRYSHIKIDSYVIMPNHIHLIIRMMSSGSEAEIKKDLMDIMCAYKSLTTRACKSVHPIDKMFQVSFYEHIIRNADDYRRAREYVYNNPRAWLLDELYSDM